MEPSGAYALNYVGIAVLGVAAVAVPLLPLLLARLVAPRRPSPAKQAPYECGVAARGDPWVLGRVQYYLTAMAFVVFDVEVLFVYPWAVVFRQVGVPGLAAMAAFIGTLVVGLGYAWQRGALDWE